MSALARITALLVTPMAVEFFSFSACTKQDAARVSVARFAQDAGGAAGSAHQVSSAGCSSDSECPPLAMCACRRPECSIDPNFYPQTGSPEGHCFDPPSRSAAWLPVRVDGGWIVEAESKHVVYPTVEKAWASQYPDEP